MSTGDRTDGGVGTNPPWVRKAVGGPRPGFLPAFV